MRRSLFGAYAVMLTFVGVQGCTSNKYVDTANTAGPWDGTKQHPFQTVQDGMNAGCSNWVLVRSGIYGENVTMKRGRRLGAWQAGFPPLITANTGAVITARGNNTIDGVILSDGSIGVKLDVAAALDSTEETVLRVRNSEFRGLSEGIDVSTPSNADFGAGVRKVVRLIVHHNWFKPMGGSGLFVNLTGPQTGELQVSLDVRDNVFQQTFTGVTLRAEGQGPNPGGFVRASYAGFISNNLIFGGHSGISLHAENLGSVGPIISYNTIAEHANHGIVASTDSGPDGAGSAHPSVIGNIFAANGAGAGAAAAYMEFDSRTSAGELSNNLFHDNENNYFDFESNSFISSQSGLNTPIVNNQVVFFGGGNNLVADPLFEDGGFPWEGGVISFSGAHRFFLTQSGGTLSPAVDAGNMSAADAGLAERSTRTDLAPDQGTADIGFHYKQP
ncbi:MAG: hypothetical protein ACE5GS_08335 [Kiloniellaceae bacterium]